MTPSFTTPRSSDLGAGVLEARIEEALGRGENHAAIAVVLDLRVGAVANPHRHHAAIAGQRLADRLVEARFQGDAENGLQVAAVAGGLLVGRDDVGDIRSEEHTSELQSLMRISYAVFW